MIYHGNQDILKLHKVGFLCSKRCTASAVLSCFDWAKEQREKGQCVIIGNHSQIERDVFDILIKGVQPIILVLARGLMKVWDARVLEAIAQERLLVISPFDSSIKRVSRNTAEIRNQKIIELSDKLVIGYKTAGGQLDTLLKNHPHHALA
ncbi:MAG: hypothetical protein RJQ14_11365 [Marinoscillum sp.]